MQNWHRWVLSIALGFLGGFCAVAQADSKAPWQDPWPYTKGGMVGVLPAIAALKMTLEKGDAAK
jgi:hypothetical protein